MSAEATAIVALTLVVLALAGAVAALLLAQLRRRASTPDSRPVLDQQLVEMRTELGKQVVLCPPRPCSPFWP